MRLYQLNICAKWTDLEYIFPTKTWTQTQSSKDQTLTSNRSSRIFCITSAVRIQEYTTRDYRSRLETTNTFYRYKFQTWRLSMISSMKNSPSVLWKYWKWCRTRLLPIYLRKRMSIRHALANNGRWFSEAMTILSKLGKSKVTWYPESLSLAGSSSARPSRTSRLRN